MKKLIFGFLITLLFILILPSGRSFAKHEALPDVIVVTGSPATASHLKKTLACYLERAGFSPDIPNSINFKSLNEGEVFKVTVPVSSSEGGVGDRQFVFKNVGMPKVEPFYVAFSNHPEKLCGSGLLFESGILLNKPVRLRYYHQGGKNVPPNYLGIYLKNNSAKPAKVHVVESVGGPSVNMIMAGHMNNLIFFSCLESNLGRVETIPAGSMFLVRQTLVKPDEVISGTMDVNLFEGGPLQVLVYASPNKDEEIIYGLKSDENDPHARGAYPLTKIYTNVTYTVGRGQAFYTIGDMPVEDMFKGKNFRGNYGVMYEYSINLVNPYDKDKTVTFIFQPRGGLATATFLIDSRTVSVGMIKAYQLARFAQITVKANSSRIVSLKTMPEDASNYPARIIIAD